MSSHDLEFYLTNKFFKDLGNELAKALSPYDVKVSKVFNDRVSSTTLIYFKLYNGSDEYDISPFAFKRPANTSILEVAKMINTELKKHTHITLKAPKVALPESLEYYLSDNHFESLAEELSKKLGYKVTIVNTYYDAASHITSIHYAILKHRTYNLPVISYHRPTGITLNDVAAGIDAAFKKYIGVESAKDAEDYGRLAAKISEPMIFRAHSGIRATVPTIDLTSLRSAPIDVKDLYEKYKEIMGIGNTLLDKNGYKLTYDSENIKLNCDRGSFVVDADKLVDFLISTGILKSED